VLEPESANSALPKLKAGLRLAPFQDGAAVGERYLVEVGETCFVAGKGMRDVLNALAERPETLEALAAIYERQTGQTVSTEVLADLLTNHIPGSLFDHTPEPKNKRPFVFSFNLIRESWVRPLSTRLGFLFSKPIALFVGVAFLAAEFLVLTRSLQAMQHPFQGWDLPLFYVAIVAVTLFHELGHASACRRFECPHGDIGFALYFIYPVFYTDVTKAWRLPPLKRAVVDLGGIYFQAILFVALTVYVMLTHDIFALRLLWVMNLTMLLTLNPIFKMDGYWLLTDLSGLSNLHQQMGETYTRAVRRLLRRPAAGDTAPRAQGVRLKVLYAYAALATVYYAFVVHFLYQSFEFHLRHYPRFAAHVLPLIRETYLTGDTGHALRQTAAFGYTSVRPLLLSVLVCFVVLRLFRFLSRTVSGAMSGYTLTVSMPRWAYTIADAVTGRKVRRG
jgi:putative peptide zinc metalloprotease protein